MTKKTKPEVFIIESLNLQDENDHLQEGDLISRMLHLVGKAGTQYYYIRTERELEEIVDLFDESDCRYRSGSFSSLVFDGPSGIPAGENV